jgi:hypothetical protein
MEDRCCSRSALIFFANLCDLCAFAVKNRVFQVDPARRSLNPPFGLSLSKPVPPLRQAQGERTSNITAPDQ